MTGRASPGGRLCVRLRHQHRQDRGREEGGRISRGRFRVVHAAEEHLCCSIDSVTHMAKMIRDKGLNRVVVAACTPGTHEPVFQDALREAGLNPYLFEFANIREQCSLVHMTDKGSASDKAKDLLRMAVARASLLRPLYRVSYKVNRSALVIGGGLSGMKAALSLANQGVRVHLVEKTDALGGLSMKIPETLEGADVGRFVEELVGEVYDNDLIDLSVGAELAEFSGYVGNFTSVIKVGATGTLKEVRHGVTIVATGAEELKPRGLYLYGDDDRVKTLLELDEMLSSQAVGCSRSGTLRSSSSAWGRGTRRGPIAAGSAAPTP